MSKRDLVFNAFNNKEVERIPVGFWFHFADEVEFSQGLENPEIVEKNIAGHQKYFDEFEPDFLKLMSDGFFGYPGQEIIEAGSAEDLRRVRAVGEDHPWITGQVELVRELTRRFGSEVAAFYNIFSPVTFFQIIRAEDAEKSVADFYHEDPEALAFALNEIGKDIKVLARKVIEEAGADGIYFSVKNIQDETISREEYLQYVGPSDLAVLEEANKVSQNNILHICGYEGARNDLTTYADYEAKAVNWAVNVEGVGISEGRELFPGKAVIGGFANSPGSLIHKGSRAQIESFTEELINEAGRTGFIIGADCTIPGDTDLEHLKWIRDKAEEVSKQA